MKVMPAFAHASASAGILREEAVTGVDGVGAARTATATIASGSR